MSKITKKDKSTANNKPSNKKNAKRAGFDKRLDNFLIEQGYPSLAKLFKDARS